jgi:hypothetical protein
MVSHSIPKTLQLSTQVVIMDAGGIVYRQAGRVDEGDFVAVYREHVNEGVAL